MVETDQQIHKIDMTLTSKKTPNETMLADSQFYQDRLSKTHQSKGQTLFGSIKSINPSVGMSYKNQSSFGITAILYTYQVYKTLLGPVKPTNIHQSRCTTKAGAGMESCTKIGNLVSPPPPPPPSFPPACNLRILTVIQPQLYIENIMECKLCLLKL